MEVEEIGDRGLGVGEIEVKVWGRGVGYKELRSGLRLVKLKSGVGASGGGLES